ncbi:hypothetical protein GAYE_SCF06G2796 [Galdieria yellowstonensis]|uniref:tRNA(adenine(34)) deaminase n=1 Tax=Galdieria yellowstonensis TaxID=3028027 RepID=A0AAV9IC20_9RHOD|nr:hypothetical protein GAYE_SCF06G2796 [Galdieria yellowstonensis]
MECNALVFVRSPWMTSFRYSASHLKKINHVCMCHTIQNRHEYFMRKALELAKESFGQGEVPIGAVLVNSNGDIIAKGRNQVERSKDATQHAEMQCIQIGSKVCGNWRLVNTTLYSTLEPCAMCLSALQLARVSLIVYGAKDYRLGAIQSWFPLIDQKHPFHQINYIGGILEEECAWWIQTFFANIRRNKHL